MEVVKAMESLAGDSTKVWLCILHSHIYYTGVILMKQDRLNLYRVDMKWITLKKNVEK